MKKIAILCLMALAVFNCKAQTDTLSFKEIQALFDQPKKDTTVWQDTVATVLLYADTSNNVLGYMVGYSVRKCGYNLADISLDPNTTTYVGGGVYQTTLLGWAPQWINKPYHIHLFYLDDKKQPLSKSIIIFQTVY